MKPAAQGRHCAACDKVVVDFSRMTDAEVLTWMQRQQSGRTCGRFATQQLNRPLLLPPTPAPRWQKWVAATAAVIGLEVGGAHEVQAQRAIPTEQHVITMGMVAVPRRVLPLSLNFPPLVIRGIVLDSTTQQPLPGVTVLIADTNVGVSTNTDGQFELILPDEFRQANVVKLQFNSIGYLRQEHFINPQTPDSVIVTLAQDTRMLSGELMVVGGYESPPWYSPRGLWQRATWLFRRH